jgi:hypothetical protein
MNSSEPHKDSIFIDQITRIQILETINPLPSAEKFIVHLSPSTHSPLTIFPDLESITPFCKDIEKTHQAHQPSWLCAAD